MIEVKNLSAGYGGKAVIENISLTIRPGEVLALVGPNGSGKSTLLRALLGLIPPVAGQVLLDGQDITAMTPRQVAQKAAFLSQSRRACGITARKLVLHARFPYLSYPRRYSRQDYAIADAALDRTGARELAQRPVNELSGGQQQKVYLAMALAQQTPCLLMDEPTTYLDIAHQFQVMALARELAREGRAVALVLHDLPMALEYAHRIAVLDRGRLAGVGAPEEMGQILEGVFDIRISKAEGRYFCGRKEG